MNNLTISDAAITLIINEETGGQKYYESTEIHPEWPGGASGVTIGIGYDLGYSTSETVASDWGQLLSEDTVAALQSVVGVKGQAAASHAHELHWISVPWDSAIQVFNGHDLPKWIDACDRDLPNFSDLSDDCRGALVSLAFNRGESWNIAAIRDAAGRYREMRAIKQLMTEKRFAEIPEQFLAMRRLWPINSGLWKRREHEAALFTQGLTATQGATS